MQQAIITHSTMALLLKIRSKEILGLAADLCRAQPGASAPAPREAVSPSHRPLQQRHALSGDERLVLNLVRHERESAMAEGVGLACTQLCRVGC